MSDRGEITGPLLAGWALGILTVAILAAALDTGYRIARGEAAREAAGCRCVSPPGDSDRESE